MGNILEFKEESYKVMIGHARGTGALRGQLERTNSELGTISATPNGKLVPHLMKAADVFIPNLTVSWGRRLIKGKARPDGGSYDVGESGYTGEIELLKYGVDGGVPLDLRYMESSTTLDYHYQVKIGMAKRNTKESEEYDYLTLESGVQDIKLSENKNLAIFLKAHHQNQDSPCRMKTANKGLSNTNVLRDVIEVDTIGKKASELDIKFEAFTLVRQANNLFKLQVLDKAINRGDYDYDEADTNSLFDAVKVFADEDPNKVVTRWNEYKIAIATLVEKFKTCEALDAKGDLITVGIGDNKSVVKHSLEKVNSKNVADTIMQELFHVDIQEVIEKMELLQTTLK